MKKIPRIAKKKNQKPKSYRLLSILTFISILLIIWEMALFRKTFIPVFIPIVLFFTSGPILFWLLRKKINYYQETAHGIVAQLLHGTIFFGGPSIFIFMALNFYFPNENPQIFNLKVVEIGSLTNRRGCDPPYATVDYYGFQKQLIFPCNTNLSHTSRIEVKLQKGLLGFMILKDWKLINSGQSESMVEDPYLKLLEKAEEYYAAGNIQKTIELYERAIRFKPSDKSVKVRLEEIKKGEKRTY